MLFLLNKGFYVAEKMVMKYLVLILFVIVNSVSAIDNPDAPDYLAEFKQRISPLESAIYNKAKTTLAYSEGYEKLNIALDKELNIAYKKLMLKVAGPHKAKLRAAQKKWLIYRDAEFRFINYNFDRSQFGSSSVLTRGGARATIVKDRVITLLRYLKNY